MTYSSQKRREQILAQVVEKRHVTARDLAADMSVSEATVRRDLKALADVGKLELVYGGATLSRVSDFSFHSKGMRNVEAKRVIGQLAAELVAEEGDQIFLDSGTTCFEVIPFLKRKRGLSVIVNSARLAMELDAPNFNVIMLGGKYRPDRMDTVGPMATSSLEQIRGYLVLLGSDGISRDFGLTAADLESANLYRLAVRNARDAVLLVDHTKFTSPSLFKIVDWDPVSRVITDREPAGEWMDFFESRRIEVIWPKAL
jgi:DeoR/GlpR family transcriptional regulator of sugar metabolism